MPGADDFVLALEPGAPAWHARSVVYEIFPDRFAASGAALNAPRPNWVMPREWDRRPEGRSPNTPYELYGGDLCGVEHHLDHIQSVGANVLYLTPFFPAGSTHRYDAASFDQVDPLLGGDEALRSLLRAAHARDMHVVGDLTLNHCGAGHEWFLRAEQNAAAPERDLFFFDGSPPLGYACWLGVRSLPTLNWGSDELRRRMGRIMRRWLDAGLDGWRIDVANMVARYRLLDVNHEVAAWARDLARGRLLIGAEAVAAMPAFRAGVPWDVDANSWTLLDSHDTARFRPSPRRARSTSSGSGCKWRRRACRCCSWDRPETWDAELLREYGALIALRRTSHALAYGGLRYVHVGDDAIAYVPSRAASACSALQPARLTIRSRSRSPTSRPCTATTHATACCPPAARHFTSGGFGPMVDVAIWIYLPLTSTVPASYLAGGEWRVRTLSRFCIAQD